MSAEQQPRAVVIGSGFGGLAAAVRLGARGYRVTVLERRDRPGGRAYVYEQDGFTFDGGPTVITAPHLFEELWQLAGRELSQDVTLKPVDPFYRIRFHDGSIFDYTGDAERMRKEVAKFSEADVEGYERFVELTERIFEVGYQQLGDMPFHNWTVMARIVPNMLRLRSYRTVYGLVSSFVRDPRLRQVLSFHPLLVGGNPLSTTSIYALIHYLERRWGVHFPLGGTGALVRGLVKLIEEHQGGSVRCSQEVRQIQVEGNRAVGVELANGERLPADIVVSNADVCWTYRNLLPNGVRRRWSDKKIERAKHSMGLFVWYFGTRRKYPDVQHHTILLGPRYEGLLQDIFDNQRLADDFSLYLHRPTQTDPSLAPEGCDGFYVLSPVPHLDSGVDWSTAAEPYRKAIAEHLSNTVLPGLEDELVTSRLLTPADFRDVLLAERGSAFSLQPILTQSAYFRPHNRSDEIEGLYLVGAGTHPGAGVPGVLTSAKVLDHVVPAAA